MTIRSNGRKPFQCRLDVHSGVPVYRQIIDQVIGGMATGALAGGDQLPTVRQLAVTCRLIRTQLFELIASWKFEVCWRRAGHGHVHQSPESAAR